MPSTLEQLLSSAGVSRAGVVGWGEQAPADEPGIYVVCLDERIDSVEARQASAPIAMEKVEGWLSERPELALDGARPSASELAARLARFWLADEVVLYIGLAGSSVSTRVHQYYATPLGARSPHAGGHWLKTLASLEELFVHCAPAPDPAAAERAMLDRFCSSVSEETREALFDPQRPLPFANLDWPGRGAKRHGITGSKAPRQKTRGPAQGVLRVQGSRAEARPTLHAELHRILCAGGNRWMTTQDLAEAVNLAGNYRKKDGTPMTAFQVHGRTRNYPHVFERDGSRVRARECP